MALMMIFSNKHEQDCINWANRSGLKYYQTDNIYRFLQYAKEVKPDIVLMRFEENFNNDAYTMNEIKKTLCPNNICPRIYLNKPDHFEGDLFFVDIRFEKEDIQKYLN